jgi:hypothetical protein
MRRNPWLSLSNGSILNRQEQYVVRQVAKGEIADRKQEFDEAAARKILGAKAGKP